MNIPRLKHLIEVLEKVEPERFDLLGWRKKTGCGTTACAIGWATLDPKFREEGLGFVEDPFGGTPVFGDWSSWNAAEHFFDLSPGLTERLFDIDEYELTRRNDPTAVIACIRELIGEAA